ncbi:MAG: SBBP repeat-containing protein, partial [Bacteroidales bacterium]|nr:SBBP repeat-containing protein [Bacteroidales bacterium]
IKPGKILIYITFLLVLVKAIPSVAQVPHWEWAKRYGGVGGIKIGYSIALDESNNLYIAGSFCDELTIEDTTINSTEDTDIFLAKFDETGSLIWIRQAGGPINDVATSITIHDNSIYITGTFDLEVTFEDTHLEIGHTLGIFLAKYDLNGNLIWVHYEGPGGSGACIKGLNIIGDYTSHLYLTGCFCDTIYINLIPEGYEDAFVAKYDTSGNLIWARQAGGSSFAGGRSVAVDNNFNVYNAGAFKDTVTFMNTMPDQVTLISNGEKDIYISKYDSSGNIIWVKQAGGILGDYGNSIATDINDNVYVTGSFYETAVFEDTSLTSMEGNDIFVLKLDSAGNRIWLKQLGSSGSNGRFIYTDNNDNFYLVGNFKGTISIGDTSLTAPMYEYYPYAFIAKFKNTGEFVWVKKVGSYWDKIKCLVSDNNGNVFITGSINLPTVYLDDITLPPVGSNDFFLAKITENPSAVKETQDDALFKLFPNPATGIVNIQIKTEKKDNLFLEIHSISGELIFRKQLSNNGVEFMEELDVNNLSPGLYFISIKGKKLLKPKKLIVY